MEQSDTISQQESHGTTDTRGMGRTQQVELCNKSVEELLDALKPAQARQGKRRITAVINVRLISFRLPRLRRYLRPILTVH